jgi:hypothetical protein
VHESVVNAIRIGGIRPYSVGFTTRIGVEGQKVFVLPHGLGSPVDLTSKAIRGPSAFGKAF